MSEENEQLPFQATAAAPPEAQPNNAEDARMETGSRVMIDNTDPNNITHSNFTTTNEKKMNERKEYLQTLVTSDLLLEDDERKNKNGHNNTNNNNIIEAFYNIAWPILESEGGWTMVRFCFFFLLDMTYFLFVVCVLQEVSWMEGLGKLGVFACVQA